MLTFDPPGDGPTNMARDCDLLRAAESGRSGARVYDWDAVWVTLGRGQRPESALIDPSGTRWIVRPTGGDAVLHGHDITVAIAVPMRRSVRHSYRLVAEPLVRALAGTGIDVALAEEILGKDSQVGLGASCDCFARRSANDLVDRSSLRKVCGCALRRTANAVLLQASIPVRRPVTEPRSIIVGGVAPSPSRLERKKFEAELSLALGQWDFWQP